MYEKRQNTYTFGEISIYIIQDDSDKFLDPPRKKLLFFQIHLFLERLKTYQIYWTLRWICEI